MRAEALSGSSKDAVGHQSSREVGQSLYPSETQEFPQTREQFIRYLMAQWPRSLVDGPEAAFDVRRSLGEWTDLAIRPLYLDRDLPRGDGSVVVIGEGFAAAPWMYWRTVDNFQGLGYQAETYPLPWGLNIEPTERMTDGFIDYLGRRRRESGRKVHLVLHSKAGHLGVAAAISHPREFQEAVDQFVNVGSPIPTRVNASVGGVYLLTQYLFGGDDFKLAKMAEEAQELFLTDGVRMTTLKVRNDPIIDGYYIGRPEDQFVVTSSHSGALVNRDNLRLMVRRLARTSLSKAA